MATLLAGTSGYSYDEWRGHFYPKGLRATDYLRYYASRLPSVEINNTFYRMPRRDVVAAWRAAVPEGFRFAIKASQRITHRKRLGECDELLGYLFDALAELGPTLGIVLFQLPPGFRSDPERLDRFLLALPHDAAVAFEFRHPSWEEPRIFERLRDHGAAWVISDDSGQVPDALTVTGPRVYLRLRQAGYDESCVLAWLKRIESSGARQAYVFFKHEEAGVGPALAKEFLERAQALAMR